ncbi:LysR substrate-binding domain-containing protein [Amphritea sp. 1_MG-2023]|uniref:LysR substrate-binding domain-containing protein n=1 Tax=Amphritea sp. 1_MG-2023 TaxID=3062670 RepID=UPI0026E11713|nr:LysR substrate-binding domain-containing protein [Amphritea sp. 1_MG-2023]MDO6562792.1 LysR substrate-binding domain-containing protein [Amphritea sp. 1_MG-2023]
MKRHIPSLQALKAFEATARLLSFQQAAKELNVTHSAVSHQIKKMEQELGKPLFERLGRSIALTDVGALYAAQIRQALHDIEASTQRLFGDPDKGELSLQIYMGIGSRWLVPRLGDFRDQYPDINIELYSSYYDWDFELNSADIGIIYSDNPESGLIYQQLFKGTLIPVCSPALMQGKSAINLDQLLAMPFLNIAESPLNLPRWLQHVGVTEPQINIVSEHDNHQLALEAAIAGKGVAIVHSFFASGDLSHNNLIIPMNHQVPEIGAWYLVQPSGTLSDSKVSHFARWLHHQIAHDEALRRIN